MQADFHRVNSRGGYAVMIRRDDGLTVRLPGHDGTVLVPHDLVHFVTEREFRLEKGVFGSIVAGAMFSNMAVMDGRPRFDANVRSRAVMRANSAEIALAEIVSGVVHRGVERGERFEVVLARLRDAWGMVRPGPYPYPAETLRRALVILSGLTEHWQALPVGQRLTLRWVARVELSEGRRGVDASR